jgi:oxygen-independent coproporphyrinogen-3 oxidase
MPNDERMTKPETQSSRLHCILMISDFAVRASLLIRHSEFVIPIDRRAAPENRAPRMDAIRHLYFHIPFCAKLCPYCSFHVETRFRHKTRGFIDAVLREVEKSAARLPLRPRTIFLGGGTPSSLSLAELEHLFAGLRERLDFSALREWTIEINPATVSRDKAGLLRDAGINRVSMGVQSWDEDVLKTLGRIHTAEQARGTFAILRDAGFANINIDLMFAVPGQTAGQWRDTLAQTVALGPEHVSTYCLTYEEDTDFFRKLGAGEFAQDDGRDAELFETTMAMLGDAGFGHYEISNHARPGLESAHNLACWEGADYAGFGPGAFSTRGTRRWQNIADTPEYTRRMLAGESVVTFEETLTPEKRTGEIVAFGLRTSSGVPSHLTEPWQGAVAEFVSLGLLERNKDRLRLTQRGRLLADSVAEAFV